jgi:hypothetical protein
VRHGRRPAAARTGGLAYLGDFVLRKQRDVAGHLAQRAGQYAAGADEPRQTVALRVPWRFRQAKAKLSRQRMCDPWPIFAERSQRAAGASELEHKTFGKGRCEALMPAMHGRKPARGPQSEGDGRRCLQQRAAQHRSPPVLLRESP